MQGGAVLVVLGLAACRPSASHDEASVGGNPVDAAVADTTQEESPLETLRARARTERISAEGRRHPLHTTLGGCPPVDQASLRAKLVRRDSRLRDLSLECVGKTNVGVVWSAERQLTQGDCDEHRSLYRHWLVLLTPAPRVVHTADSEDGGCLFPSQRRPFDAVFTRDGVMVRRAPGPDGRERYERLEPEGFRFDATASAELEREDAQLHALAELASLPDGAPLDTPAVLAAREVMGW